MNHNSEKISRKIAYQNASVSLAEMAVILVLVVVVLWLWIDPLTQSAINAHNADREALNQFQVLDLQPQNEVVD